jgi:hypothetical protein
MPIEEEKKLDVVVEEKRPHSPINKELLYMGNLDHFIKK